jgi:hypothetical protein
MAEERIFLVTEKNHFMNCCEKTMQIKYPVIVEMPVKAAVLLSSCFVFIRKIALNKPLGKAISAKKRSDDFCFP